MKFPSFLIICMFFSQVQARTWTDIKGRTLEADLVRADVTSVTVKMNGKEVNIPLNRLSEKDQDFVQQWLKDGSSEMDADEEDAEDAPATPSAGNKPAPAPTNKAAGGATLTFDGKPMEAGGKINLYEYDYDAETLERVTKKHKSTDTGYKLGIAVPQGFDPAKPQKVFVAMTAVNNDAQARSGNTSAMRTYAKHCVESGWVCIAYDTSIGVANHNADILCCFALLNRVWPGFRSWQFAVGGFSGGSKACFDPCAYLLKEDYTVVGAYLGGCNHDYSQHGKELYKTSSGDYRKLKIYMSTGKSDNLVKESHRVGVINSLKANGMKNVKDMVFDGGHTFYQPQFIEALKWFESSED